MTVSWADITEEVIQETNRQTRFLTLITELANAGCPEPSDWTYEGLYWFGGPEAFTVSSHDSGFDLNGTMKSGINNVTVEQIVEQAKRWKAERDAERTANIEGIETAVKAVLAAVRPLNLTGEQKTRLLMSLGDQLSKGDST